MVQDSSRVYRSRTRSPTLRSRAAGSSTRLADRSLTINGRTDTAQPLNTDTGEVVIMRHRQAVPVPRTGRRPSFPPRSPPPGQHSRPLATASLCRRAGRVRLAPQAGRNRDGPPRVLRPLTAKSGSRPPASCSRSAICSRHGHVRQGAAHPARARDRHRARWLGRLASCSWWAGRVHCLYSVGFQNFDARTLTTRSSAASLRRVPVKMLYRPPGATCPLVLAAGAGWCSAASCALADPVTLFSPRSAAF